MRRRAREGRSRPAFELLKEGPSSWRGVSCARSRKGGTGRCGLRHVDFRLKRGTAFATQPAPCMGRHGGVCCGNVLLRITNGDRRRCRGWLTSRWGGGHFGTAATGAGGRQGQRHIQPDMPAEYGSAAGVSFVRTIKRRAQRFAAGCAPEPAALGRVFRGSGRVAAARLGRRG